MLGQALSFSFWWLAHCIRFTFNVQLDAIAWSNYTGLKDEKRARTIAVRDWLQN